MNDTIHGPRALSMLHRAVTGVLEDPDVRGDLLIVGVALARHTTCESPPCRLEDAVVNAFPGDRGECAARARTALAADVPRWAGPGYVSTGGALSRHLPWLDWRRIWDDLTPAAAGHTGPRDTAEGQGLRLYLDTETPCPVEARPALTVVRPPRASPP